jgi:hypothetical protein
VDEGFVHNFASDYIFMVLRCIYYIYIHDIHRAVFHHYVDSDSYQSEVSHIQMLCFSVRHSLPLEIQPDQKFSIVEMFHFSLEYLLYFNVQVKYSFSLQFWPFRAIIYFKSPGITKPQHRYQHYIMLARTSRSSIIYF